MINSDTWWPFGKITGCFSWESSVKFLRRSPTQSSPLQCTKGSSCNRFECLGTDLFLSSKDNASSSAEKKLLSVLPRLQPGQLVQAQLPIEEAKGWLACLGPLISPLERSYERNYNCYNCTPQGGPAGKALKSLTAKTFGWVCWFGTGDDFPFHLRVSFAEAYLQEWSLSLEQQIP